MLYVYESSVFIVLPILAQAPFQLHLDYCSQALLHQTMPVDVGGRAVAGRVAIFVKCLHEAGVMHMLC